MSARYHTVGGYPNTDPYYISPEEEAQMRDDVTTVYFDDDVIAAARRLDQSAAITYALSSPYNLPRDARLVARALLTASEEGEGNIAKRLEEARAAVVAARGGKR